MDPLQTLTQINLDDLIAAFGFGHQPTLNRATRQLFHAPARKFAQQVLDFDSAIAQRGLPTASRQIERLYARDVRVFCADRIPAGPILALANHPGMTDTLALFC
ncbi:MAG TPA: hypothetical protein VHM28_04520, partial [Anaerolineales bacterium]|nr:hypothetical protein [Anaerolineales bacterium]